MKRRNPWIAALFSLVAPGLGQLYNGNAKLALAGFFLSGAFTVFAIFFLFDSLAQLMVAVSVGIALDLVFAVQAWREARRILAMELKPFQRWWSYVAFAALLYGIPDGYGTLMPTRVMSFQIPSQSMVPTLLVGDRLVADGWAYWGKEPARGDVIVFDYPKDPKTKYVKRIVGVPGDVVEFRQGELYLNGKIVPQRRSGRPSYWEKGWEHVEFLETLGEVEHPIYRAQPMSVADFGPVTVPEGSYFVLGDNRDRSNDSRIWGFVKRSEIIAQMKYIYWSWDEESGGLRKNRLGWFVR